MSDALEIFGQITQIRARLEAIEHTQEVLIRAQSGVILEQIWTAMDTDSVMARVYLSVDGKTTQTGIVEKLQAEGATGASHASVSRKLVVLANDLHLVELVDHIKDGKIYRRTAIDRILNLSKKLERRIANGVAKK